MELQVTELQVDDIVKSPYEIGLENWIMFLISITVISLLWYLWKVEIKKRELSMKVNYDITNPNILTDHVKNRVWIASRAKLEHMRTTLLLNWIKWREEDVWLKVINFLWNQTQIYLDEFSSLHTPYGDLWDLYKDCFELENFEKEIKEKFFSILKCTCPTDIDKELCVYKIIDDIGNIMMKHQMSAASKFLIKIKLKKIENDK